MMAMRREGEMAEAMEAGSGKPRKRAGGKPAARQGGNKLKTTIHLNVSASQKLTVHAAMMGIDRSALVEKLINDHLRRYVVSDRGGLDSADGEDAAA